MLFFSPHNMLLNSSFIKQKADLFLKVFSNVWQNVYLIKKKQINPKKSSSVLKSTKTTVPNDRCKWSRQWSQLNNYNHERTRRTRRRQSETNRPRFLHLVAVKCKHECWHGGGFCPSKNSCNVIFFFFFF